MSADATCLWRDPPSPRHMRRRLKVGASLAVRSIIAVRYVGTVRALGGRRCLEGGRRAPAKVPHARATGVRVLEGSTSRNAVPNPLINSSSRTRYGGAVTYARSFPTKLFFSLEAAVRHRQDSQRLTGNLEFEFGFGCQTRTRGVELKGRVNDARRWVLDEAARHYTYRTRRTAAGKSCRIQVR